VDGTHPKVEVLVGDPVEAGVDHSPATPAGTCGSSPPGTGSLAVERRGIKMYFFVRKLKKNFICQKFNAGIKKLKFNYF
jgi:hypothetical protein